MRRVRTEEQKKNERKSAYCVWIDDAQNWRKTHRQRQWKATRIIRNWREKQKTIWFRVLFSIWLWCGVCGRKWNEAIRIAVAAVRCVLRSRVCVSVRERARANRNEIHINFGYTTTTTATVCMLLRSICFAPSIKCAQWVRGTRYQTQNTHRINRSW